MGCTHHNHTRPPPKLTNFSCPSSTHPPKPAQPQQSIMEIILSQLTKQLGDKKEGIESLAMLTGTRRSQALRNKLDALQDTDPDLFKSPAGVDILTYLACVAGMCADREVLLFFLRDMGVPLHSAVIRRLIPSLLAFPLLRLYYTHSAAKTSSWNSLRSLTSSTWI